MTNVRGYSDDLVYIERNSMGMEIPCETNETIEIEFEDGTVINITYGVRYAIWTIRIIKRGTATATHYICSPHDEETYSDSFDIDSVVKRIH